MMVAGEASGDNHGAAVAAALREKLPDVDLFGIGGVRMRGAGVRTLIDAAELAVVGLVEVIRHFSVIYRAYARMVSILKHEPPDLLLLIDYPDFNLRLAKAARKNGVKVLYFVSPQVWAWRANRVTTIAQRVDHMAVLFPFEVPYYEKVNLPVTFVGHPLLDTVHPSGNRPSLQKEFNLDPVKPTVGLFPGSRRSELRSHFATLIATAKELKCRHPELQFILPLATSLKQEDLDPYLADLDFPVRIIPSRSLDVMEVCDAIVAVSGTVTLEIALMGIPMVIIYKVSPLTYQLGKRLIKIDHFGLCNIVAEKRVVPELLQHEASPERITEELERFLYDTSAADSVKADLHAIRAKLGNPGCSRRVAEIALSLLDAHRSPQDRADV